MLTQEQLNKIKTVVWGHELGSGRGTRKTACSIASINLALSGELTDIIPECMSLVVGEWVKPIQDAMPAAMRNSPEWRDALVQAAGTGRKKERERVEMIRDWLFGTVLPIMQPHANAGGYGPEWENMCDKKTKQSAHVARLTAGQTQGVASRAAAARLAARAAAEAAWAALAAEALAEGPLAAGRAAVAVSEAMAWAARAAGAVAAAARIDFWQQANPPALLARLVEVSE